MIENVHNDWNHEADGRRSIWQNSPSEISPPERIYDGWLKQKDQAITKKHLKKRDSLPNCFTESCQRKFSCIKRPHHCRRCGELFCSTCLQYQRKLNVLAHPDPEGKPYKVCRSCFEEGEDSPGCARSSSEEIKVPRRAKGQQLRQKYASTTSSRRDKLDIKQECQRLLMGFRKSIGTSEVKRTLQEMRTVIKTPKWQKSSMWRQENISEFCQSCRTMFTLLNMKRHCKVCGMVLCKSCSYKELLIYLPDESDTEESTPPQLRVIQFIGCPEVEPKISLLLRICSLCKEKLVVIQLSAVELDSKSKDASEFISNLLAIDGTASYLQNKIVNQLTKYQEVIESMEDNTTRTSRVVDENVLAKTQEDLSDYLGQYASKLELAKSLKPAAISDTQKLLMTNYLWKQHTILYINLIILRHEHANTLAVLAVTLCVSRLQLLVRVEKLGEVHHFSRAIMLLYWVTQDKSRFYLDNMYTFSKMKAKLSNSAPTEVLGSIRRRVARHTAATQQQPAQGSRTNPFL